MCNYLLAILLKNKKRIAKPIKTFCHLTETVYCTFYF